MRHWEAILLAAGASSRMGRPKALLAWSGRSLVAHQLAELLATRVRRAVLVLGAKADLIAKDPEVRRLVGAGRADVVENARWAEGKCGSIRLGARALSPSATDVVLLAVDQPTAAEVLEALMGEHERLGSACSVPLHGGRRGHPVLLAARLRERLEALREEEMGLRALLGQLDAAGELRELPVRAPCVRWDLNRPEDLPAAAGETQRQDNPRSKM